MDNEEKEIVDTAKAQELVEHLNSMTSNEIGYAFENMNYEGIVNLNCIISHVLLNLMYDTKDKIDKAKH